jgi:hypothetical protein
VKRKRNKAMTTRDENIKLIAEELKGRGFKDAKWPGLVIATQDPELPKGIEKIKENYKTSYENLISGGVVVKLGEGGATFDPCTEFTKLTDDEKDKLTAEAIKIIEKRKDMKR